jgi:IMP dehydrogenase
MQFLDANGVVYSPNRWLSFDDVLLLPQYSDLNSRNDPRISLETYITNKIKRPIPIISSNMDTVTDANMAINMFDNGGLGILHRFYESFNLFLDDCNKVLEKCNILAFSIGCNKQDINIVHNILNIAQNKTVIVCVDVAHGNMQQNIDQVKRLNSTFQNNIQIVAGNVTTPDGVAALVTSGANAVKIGIGNGSFCSTRVVTGHGAPILTSIIHARRAINSLQSNAALIVDGGIRNSGDIVKALAAGADSVMIGKLFANTNEAPGERKIIDNQTYKLYRGQSSRNFLDHIGRGSEIAAEGVSDYMLVNKSIKSVLSELIGGIKSGLTYSGCRNLTELSKKGTFLEITTAGYIESQPHGLNNKFEQII